jgi:hypothetical protein
MRIAMRVLDRDLRLADSREPVEGDRITFCKTPLNASEKLVPAGEVLVHPDAGAGSRAACAIHGFTLVGGDGREA